jgi:hypothetical protein
MADSYCLRNQRATGSDTTADTAQSAAIKPVITTGKSHSGRSPGACWLPISNGSIPIIAPLTAPHAAARAIERSTSLRRPDAIPAKNANKNPLGKPAKAPPMCCGSTSPWRSDPPIMLGISQAAAQPEPTNAARLNGVIHVPTIRVPFVKDSVSQGSGGQLGRLC